MSNADDTNPPWDGEEANNVVSFDKKKKEEQDRRIIEDAATDLAEATNRACLKKDSAFFSSTYLIDGFVYLEQFQKDSVIVKERLHFLKRLIVKHPDENVKKVFEGAVQSARLAVTAEKQRRLAELREKQLSLAFDEYELDKYASYSQQNGLPNADIINAQLAMKHLGVIGKFNVYKEEQTALYNNEPVDIDVLWNDIYHRTRVQWSKDRLIDALDMYCKRQSYHPIKDYFDSVRHLESKGVIENWMTVCLGAEDTPLNREIGKKMIVAMIARTYNPGTKFDQMVVWEGPQGVGKSSILEMLCGSENFNSGKILDEDNMKIAEALKGRMIYESAELIGHNKDIDRLKSMLSKTSDKGRWVYDRKVKDHPRTAIIVGTTNRSNYLIDETGNRRFWPVVCCAVPTANMINGKPYVDFKWMEENRDQLFAEGLRLYDSGYSLVLDNSLWPEVAALQNVRMTEVSGSEKVGDILGFTEAEGLYIIESEEWIDLKIHTCDIVSHLFPYAHTNVLAGRQVKAAVISYNHLDHNLRWEYHSQLRIGKVNNSGYRMIAEGKEVCAYLKEMIEVYRARRRQAGIGSSQNAM